MNKRQIAIVSLISGGLLLGGLAIARGLYAAHGGHHSSKMGMICSGDRSAKLDKMTNVMTSKLNLTEEQVTRWRNVTDVVQNSDVQSLCNLKNSEEVAATDRLKQVELAMSQGLDTIQKVQTPFNNFYASLDTEQQQTLNGWFAHRKNR